MIDNKSNELFDLTNYFINTLVKKYLEIEKQTTTINIFKKINFEKVSNLYNLLANDVDDFYNKINNLPDKSPKLYKVLLISVEAFGDLLNYQYQLNSKLDAKSKGKEFTKKEYNDIVSIVNEFRDNMTSSLENLYKEFEIYTYKINNPKLLSLDEFSIYVGETIVNHTDLFFKQGINIKLNFDGNGANIMAYMGYILFLTSNIIYSKYSHEITEKIMQKTITIIFDKLILNKNVNAEEYVKELYNKLNEFNYKERPKNYGKYFNELAKNFYKEIEIDLTQSMNIQFSSHLKNIKMYLEKVLLDESIVLKDIDI